MPTDEVDALLEGYLHLLDHYTSLRAELNKLQSSVHQDIARANFSTDRGIRYGQDYYDSRMRASRSIRLDFQNPDSDIPAFTTVKAPIAPVGSKTHGLETDQQSQDLNLEPPDSKLYPRKRHQPLDPLHMFGILTPPLLRSAQRSAVAVVENIIPQLASVDAQMREMEIRIRRAKKHYKREIEKGNNILQRGC